MPAPIALFVYNRLAHTRKTVEALQKNHLASASELIVFSDGPKDDAGASKIIEVRDYIKTIHGFKSVRIIERTENWGLARSILAGVTDIVNRQDGSGTVIVMEDDLITSPYFLQYMNDGLDLYKNESRVASIHGYIYPVSKPLPETFFLRGADCWGWATWKRAWSAFEPDGAKLLSELQEKNLIRTFDLDGSYGFSHMLKRQIEGRNNSWAVRWHASAFLADMLTLYPGISLVDNIGQDLSGTHKGSARFKYESLEERKVRVTKIPVDEDTQARSVIVNYMRSLQPRLIRRILHKIRQWV